MLQKITITIEALIDEKTLRSVGRYDISSYIFNALAGWGETFPESDPLYSGINARRIIFKKGNRKRASFATRKDVNNAREI